MGEDIPGRGSGESVRRPNYILKREER